MKFLSLLLVYTLVSCSALPGKSVPIVGSSSVELGTIGSFTSDEISKHFVLSGIPEIQNKLRIVVSNEVFDKSSTKKFNKTQLSDDKKIVFDDSLQAHSSYLKLSIGDKVNWLKELNAPQNKQVISYLKSAHKPVLISSVSLLFPTELHSKLLSANEVYLVNNDKRKYMLELYQEGRLTSTLDFQSACVFDYKTSKFCWGENQKHQIVLVGVDQTGCGKQSSESFHKAEKKKESFKF